MTLTPLENEFCCGQIGGINYVDVSNGTTPCYLCPPIEYEILDTNSEGEEIVVGFTKPDGTVKQIDQTCCNLRYGVNNWITPPGEIVVVEGTVIELAGVPYCLKPQTVIDSEENNESF